MKAIVNLWLALVLISVGCAGQPQGSDSASPKSRQTAQNASFDAYQSTAAKKIAEQNKSVDEAAAVAINREISVALKVSNFNRLFLKSIRKDVYGKIKDRFPEHKVHVTTDSKLSDDIRKLESSARQNLWKNQKDTYRKLQKINEDMKG